MGRLLGVSGICRRSPRRSNSTSEAPSRTTSSWPRGDSTVPKSGLTERRSGRHLRGGQVGDGPKTILVSWTGCESAKELARDCPSWLTSRGRNQRQAAAFRNAGLDSQVYGLPDAGRRFVRGYSIHVKGCRRDPVPEALGTPFGPFRCVRPKALVGRDFEGPEFPESVDTCPYLPCVSTASPRRRGDGTRQPRRGTNLSQGPPHDGGPTSGLLGLTEPSFREPASLRAMKYNLDGPPLAPGWGRERVE